MTEHELAGGPGQGERFITCAKVSDLADGSMVGVTVEGRQILIGRMGGDFYAMDAVCSHLSGYLPKGRLEKGVVTCPVHGAQFDITTGRVVKNVGMSIRMATRREATDLKTYKVKVVGDEVLVAVNR